MTMLVIVGVRTEAHCIEYVVYRRRRIGVKNADSRIYCRSLTAGRAPCIIQEAEGERHLSGSQDAVYYTVWRQATDCIREWMCPHACYQRYGFGLL